MIRGLARLLRYARHGPMRGHGANSPLTKHTLQTNGIGNNYPMGIRKLCAEGKHARCLASRCACECHHPERTIQ